MVMTTHGERDPATLRRVDGSVDNDWEYTTWVEYWDGEECVHRSVHVTLKQAPQFEPVGAGGFNG